MATRTLGLSGRNYSTLAAWRSYAAALGSLAADEILEVYNDGGAVVDSAQVDVNGWTANGHNVIIRPASGQGFGDHANRLTNALRYNASNGAALTNTGGGYGYGYVLNGGGLIVRDLQIRCTSGAAFATINPGNNVVIERCIINKSTSGGSVVRQTTGGFAIRDTLVHAGSSGSNGIKIEDGGGYIEGCSIVSTGAGAEGIPHAYSFGTVAKNTVVFGFSTRAYGVGAPNSASTNNATDKSSFEQADWGISGQTNVASSDFGNVSSGTEDWKIVTGSTKLKNTGAASVGSGQDIVKTSRPQGASNDIGAWEVAAADTTAPTITGPGGVTTPSTSSSSVSIPENTTTVYTFTANEAVTWSLNGGADVAKFAINSSSGALSFLSAPDYETPTDADTNNTYVVGVRATDGASNATTQTCTVTVTDAAEGGGTTFSNLERRAGRGSFRGQH